MLKKLGLTVASLGLAIGVARKRGARHAQGGVQVGTLTCNVAGGWGFVFGSSKALRCTFGRAGGRPSATRARSTNLASISGTRRAACWSGVYSRRARAWRRAHCPAIMSAQPAAPRWVSERGPTFSSAAPIARSRCSPSASKATPASMSPPASDRSACAIRHRPPGRDTSAASQG